MNGSLFAELDRFCGQFTLALHNAELQIYAVLTLLLVLNFAVPAAGTTPTRPDCAEPRW